MELKILSGKKAKELAIQFCPDIIQEWKSIKDFPTQFVIDTPENMERNLPWLISQPELLFKVTENDEYYFIYYTVFHPFDWSDSGIPFMRKLDSHTFDTESILLRISKHSGNNYIATRYHNEILFSEMNPAPVVYIEAEGHGIIPECDYDASDNINLAIYQAGCIIFTDITQLKANQLKFIKDCLTEAGVDIPEEQGDIIWLMSPFGTKHKRDDMFNHPDKLFQKALETGRI
jgi:hypothetical protein